MYLYYFSHGWSFSVILFFLLLAHVYHAVAFAAAAETVGRFIQWIYYRRIKYLQRLHNNNNMQPVHMQFIHCLG